MTEEVKATVLIMDLDDDLMAVAMDQDLGDKNFTMAHTIQQTRHLRTIAYYIESLFEQNRNR